MLVVNVVSVLSLRFFNLGKAEVFRAVSTEYVLYFSLFHAAAWLPVTRSNIQVGQSQPIILLEESKK